MGPLTTDNSGTSTGRRLQAPLLQKENTDHGVTSPPTSRNLAMQMPLGTAGGNRPPWLGAVAADPTAPPSGPQAAPPRPATPPSCTAALASLLVSFTSLRRPLSFGESNTSPSLHTAPLPFLPCWQCVRWHDVLEKILGPPHMSQGSDRRGLPGPFWVTLSLSLAPDNMPPCVQRQRPDLCRTEGARTHRSLPSRARLSNNSLTLAPFAVWTG